MDSTGELLVGCSLSFHLLTSDPYPDLLSYGCLVSSNPLEDGIDCMNWIALIYILVDLSKRFVTKRFPERKLFCVSVSSQ